MVKTRRCSRNKRKTTRRTRRRQPRHNKGGGPKVDPSEEDAPKIMAQPPHHTVTHPPLQLSFTPAERDLLLGLGGRAEHIFSHLGIPRKNHHNDAPSAIRAPLVTAKKRVMANAMINAIHASVDQLRARGDFANARVQLDRALELGSIRARVELADMLYDGRIGAMSSVGKDRHIAHVLVDVDDPVVRENPDCIGLLAFFELEDGDHSARVRDDADKSARAKSKYGMFALGAYFLDQRQIGRAAQCFERSANANYDRAQDALGSVLLTSAEASAKGDRDRAEALRLFTSAADQGLPVAMFHLGDFYRAEAERRMADDADDADDADLRRMIFAARHWYKLSNYPCDEGEFEELEELENSFKK